MTEIPSQDLNFDVVVIGGSLSGSSTALQILRRKPKCRLCILEKSTDFGRRVGESTVEVSAYFLGKHLNLSDHLNRKHLIKQGLRFHFGNHRSQRLADCGEVGPHYNVRMPSYQVDRTILDAELLQQCQDSGATLFRPCTVREIELNEGGDQVVHCELPGAESLTLRARWIVDASGRSTLIGRKLGLIRPNTEHPISSIWARFTGIPNWEELGRKPGNIQWGSRVHGLRDTGTNHLMGDGYWIWLIPLSTGETSIGAVYDERLISFPKGVSLADRLLDLIQRHPGGNELMAEAKMCEGDLHFRRKISYFSEKYAGNGWVTVGDAAAFLDPFYSPGMDWIAFTSNAASRLVLAGLKDSFIDQRIDRHNENFSASYERWFRAIYKDKYFYLGDLQIMDIAFRTDLGMYYLGVVRPLMKARSKNWNRPPFSHAKAKRAVWFLARRNARFVKIANRRRASGRFGQLNHQTYRPFDSYGFNWTLKARLTFLALRSFGLEIREAFKRSPKGSSPTPKSPQNEQGYELQKTSENR